MNLTFFVADHPKSFFMSFLIFRHFPPGPVQFGLSLSNNLVSMRLLWLMTLAPDFVNTRS